jgi:tetratricopeptide (TPR) repeat protein
MDPMTEDRALIEATRLLQQQQLGEAARLLEQFLLTEAAPPSPNRLALELLAAQVAFLLRQWPKAEEHYRQAAAIALRLPEGAAERARVEVVRSRTSGLHPRFRPAARQDLEASLDGLREVNDLPALLEGLLALCHLLLLDADWELAVERCDQLGEVARILHRRPFAAAAGLMKGMALRGQGRLTQAASCLQEALVVLGDLSPDLAPEPETGSLSLPPLHAQALLVLARVRADQGRRGEVPRLLQQCLDLEVPGFDLESNLSARLLSLLFPAGAPAGGAAAHGQALRRLVLAAEGRLPEEAEVWVEAALALARRAVDPEDGRGLVEKLLLATRQLGLPELQGRCVRLQAGLLLRLGEPERAAALLREELARQAEGQGPAWLVAGLRVDLAQLLLIQGWLEEALALAEGAVPVLEAAGHELGLLQALHVAAEASRSARLLDRAAAHLARAEELCPRLGDELAAALILLERAMLLHDRGQGQEALLLFRQLLELAERLEDGGLLANALIHMGNLHLARGERDQARALLARAARLEHLDQLPRARLQLMMAEARLWAGSPTQSAELTRRLHEALELARQLRLGVEERQIVLLLQAAAADRV